MQVLGFFSSSHNNSRGFSLAELLICLALVGSLAAIALPNWQRFQEARRIEAVRDQLVSDLQSARLRALQKGEALQLERLSNCAWASMAETDWSCGWQLRHKADATVLQIAPLETLIKVTFGKSVPLEISARGDLGAIGERWVIQSVRTTPSVAMTLCINSASRVRWLSGESCS
jgi:prepilin-type N-terminal cleavage/methylation domain-containing protein